MKPGKYEHVTGWDARWNFLLAVFDEAPRCRFELTVLACCSCPKVKFNDPLLEGIRSQIRQWGHRWHLTDWWCLEYALIWVLIIRYTSPFLPDTDPSPWETARNSPSDGIPPFRFECPGWNRIGQSRYEHEAMVRQRFERDLREYYDDADRQALAEGLAPVPEKRCPEHYHWLARNQVRGDSIVTICESLNGNRRSYEAVKKAIRETRKELGLTRR
jgi:hypothetical protein